MRFGKARHRPGVMNGTETKYAGLLEMRKRAGEITDYIFESVTLKIAQDCRYTPDFMVVNKDLEIEFHEVKGFWQDDAKVKIKVAAAKFPFRFVAIKLEKGQWKEEEF